jgi:small subunit ribosomal protein S16
VGSKKNPIWRVVVADQRSPRDGRFIETIGHYNPQTDPSTIVIDSDRLQHWLARGAQPTGTVKQLVKAHSKGLTADPRTSTAAPPPVPAPPAVDEPPAAEETPATPDSEDEPVIEPPSEGTPPREAADEAADVDVPDDPADPAEPTASESGNGAEQADAPDSA